MKDGASIIGCIDAADGERLTMTNFVLIHGAWHGGWCYERIARLLRRPPN